MEVEVIEEVTLEDMIVEVEDNLKLLRGKESVWAKSQKQDLEGQLEELKEQQPPGTFWGRMPKQSCRLRSSST